MEEEDKKTNTTNETESNISEEKQVEEKTPTIDKPTSSKKESVKEDVVDEEKNVEDLIPKGPYQTDILFHSVADYFNIKSEEFDSSKDKLSEIVEYVIRSEKTNAVDLVLKALRRIEDEIQPPMWGERRYTNVHKYIILAGKELFYKDAKKIYERNK